VSPVSLLKMFFQAGEAGGLERDGIRGRRSRPRGFSAELWKAPREAEQANLSHAMRHFQEVE
jgi:hypothetical protein